MSSETSSEPVLSFKDICIGFDQGDVLSGLSFSVAPQETKVLIGESGTGKTLLLKLAAGLLRPDSGTVRLLGRDLGSMSEEELLAFRRKIGFVFQEGALFDSLTVADNVAYSLREEHVSEEEVEPRVRESLRFVEMEDTMEKLPSELSGGMRRRVSIARALISRPQVVLYDSPTAGLDPVTSQTIITLILRLRDTQGVTSVMATHRLQDAFGLANYRFNGEAGHVEHIVPVASGLQVEPGLRSGGFQVEPGLRSDGLQVEPGLRSDGLQVEPAPVSQNGNGPVAGAATNFVVLRWGKVYFEGSPQAIEDSQDEYLRRFLL